MGKKSNIAVETELIKIGAQLLRERETISLKEADELLSKCEKEVQSIEENEITKEIKREIMNIFMKIIGLSGDFYMEKWQAGKVRPTDEELDLLKKNVLTSEKLADEEYQEDSRFSSEDILELREKLEEIKKAVEEEKTKRKNSSDNNDDKDNDNDKSNDKGKSTPPPPPTILL